MNTKETPDFGESGWRPLYRTDFFYNPATEKYEPVRLVEPVAREKQALARQLAGFWFARAHCFRHADQPLEGLEIRVFDKKPAIRRWGPVGDREIWATAAWIRDRWCMLKSEKDWQFGYDLSNDKRELIGIDFWVRSVLVAQYSKKDLLK